jgi:hypothetical protein
MTDGILYTSNGSNLITVGANLLNQTVTGNLAIANIVSTTGMLIDQQSSTYNLTIRVNGYNTTFGNSGLLTIPNGISANGSNGTAGQVLTSNGTSAYWSTIAAASGVNVDSQYIWSNTQTFSNVITFSQTINGTANNTLFVGTVAAANVVSNAQLSGNLANYPTTAQLSSNLANYQTTAGLSSNVAALTANNTSFVGSVAAANIVSNTQLSSNLANYQTTAGLASNVATLTSNSTNFVGSIPAGNVVSNAQLVANLANYQTSSSLASNVATLTANNTSFVGSVAAANVVSNAQLVANLANYPSSFQLSSNLANYAALSGAAFTNNVSINGDLVVSGNLYLSGNTTFVNSTVITTKDKYIIFSNNALTSAAADGSGIIIGTYANLIYSSAASAWQSNVNIVPSTNNLLLGNTTSVWNINANQIAGTLTTTSQPNITANNTSFVGTVPAANVVSNGQLSSNLANYQTTAGLSSNVAALTANNTSFVGSVAAANIVSNTQLSSNLSNYFNLTGSYTLSNTQTFSNNITFGNNTSNNIVNSSTVIMTNANLEYDVYLSQNSPEFGGANVGAILSLGLSFRNNGPGGSTQYFPQGSGYALTTNLYNVNTSYMQMGNSTNYMNLTVGTNAPSIKFVTPSISGGGLTANQTGFYAGNSTISVAANTSGFYINGSTAYINSTYADTKAASAYSNAIAYTNTNIALKTGTTFTGNVIVNANLVVNTVVANGLLGTTGQILTANSTGGLYWATDQAVGNVTANIVTSNTLNANHVVVNNDLSVVNGTFSNVSMYSDKIFIGNSSVNSTINSTSFSGIANNTLFVGTVAAANVVSNTQLSSNLANYINTTGNYTISGVYTYSSNIVINNNKNLNFQTSNTSAYVSLIQQNDDNFVFYTTNASYGQRAVWSIYANSGTSSFNFSTPVTFNANVNIGALVANGSVGTLNQVLTSNGSTVFWSSPGAAAVNTAAQYTWTNTNIFNSNVSFNGYGVGIQSGSLIYFNGISDGNWKMGRNSAATTKWIYTNNTIDIITSNSSLEGFVVGQVGNNTYLESGYLGTYIRNNLVVGNSTSNSTINSTAFTGSANNSSYLAGVAAASYVNTSGAYTITGVHTHNANIIFGTSTNISANGSYGSVGQVLTSNGTSLYWATDQAVGNVTANIVTSNTLSANHVVVNNDLSIVNGTFSNVSMYSDRIFIGNSTVNTTINSTSFTGTANNTLFVGTVAAANVVSNAQLSGNLANYPSSFQLSSNLANYAALAGAAFTGSVSYSNNILINSNTGNYFLVGNTTSNIVINSTSIAINGSVGTTGQVLTSNGTVTSWTSPSAGSVNTASQYTFTNVITHTANLVVNGAIIAGGVSGSAGQVLTSNGTGNVYWATASAGVNTAAQYTFTNTITFSNTVTFTNFSNAVSSSFTANGSQTTFTLGTAVRNQNNSIVTLDGMVQVPTTHYSITGTTLTMTSAPIANSIVEVRNFDNIIAGGGVSTGKAIAMAIVFGG